MAGVRTRRGVVVAFDDAIGYGDVQSTDDQRTYFFHCTQISDDTRTIAVGAEVTFRVVAGRMGRWEAVDLLPRGSGTLAGDSGTLAGDSGMARANARGAFVCPVCAAPVPGEAGQYEVCGVCGWEDDPVQSADQAYAGGANTMSLVAAQADWRRRQA